MSRWLILGACVALVTGSAWAEEPTVTMPKTEAAELFAKAEEHAVLTAKVAALERHIQLFERREALIQELDQLKDAKLGLQAELTNLAKQEAEFWKDRAKELKTWAEEVERRASRDVKFARMQSYTAIGAAVGGTVFPPLGILIGGVLGLAAGWVLP